MDKVNAKLRRVASCHMGHIVTKLVFLLISVDGKGGDRRDKLIVAKSFKAGGGMKIRAERKRQRKTQVRIADLDVMKIAGLKNKVADPSGRKFKFMVEQQTVIAGRGGGSCGGQRGRLQ